jgi:hypothetical protein
MNSSVKFPTPHAVTVDWDAPHLQTLLQRVESWRLDQRGEHAPQDVQLFIGLNAMTSRPGLLVWVGHDTLVLQTMFPLHVGERIRVERHCIDSVQCVWGEVEQSRPGRRPGDAAQGIQIQRLRLQAQSH